MLWAACLTSVPQLTCWADLDSLVSCFQGGTSGDKAVLGPHPREEEAREGCHQRGEVICGEGGLLIAFEGQGSSQEQEESCHSTRGGMEKRLGEPRLIWDILLQWAPRPAVLNLWVTAPLGVTRQTSRVSDI